MKQGLLGIRYREEKRGRGYLVVDLGIRVDRNPGSG